MEERATSLQDAEQQQANSQSQPHPLETAHHIAGREAGLRGTAESANSVSIRIPAQGVDSNSDSDDENSSDSSSSSSEEEEEEREVETNNSRVPSSPLKRSQRETGRSSSSRDRTKSNQYPRSQLASRRRPSSSSRAQRTKKKNKMMSRTTRLDSGGGATSSTSEAEFPLNGTSQLQHLRGNGRRDGNRRSRELSKCSSVYETANEDYITVDDKRIMSPGSDGTSGGIPKATRIEDLTARNLSVPKMNQRQGQKRKRSTGVSERGRKKSRLESGSSVDGGPISKLKTMNGLVNGSGDEVDIKPLDLVWAKCRGYPPYPALVSAIELMLNGQQQLECDNIIQCVPLCVVFLHQFICYLHAHT